MTVERLVARVLFWGGVLAIALMVVGLAGYAIRAGAHGGRLSVAGETTGRTGAAAGVFTSVSQVGAGLRRRPIDPLAVAAVGVLVLLATPVAAVIAAIPAFRLAGDRRYAVVATVLAAVLVIGLLVGGG